MKALDRRYLTAVAYNEVAHPTRFERVTFAFGGQRSIQLSYGCVAVHLADWPGRGNGPRGPEQRMERPAFDGATRF